MQRDDRMYKLLLTASSKVTDNTMYDRASICILSDWCT